MKLAVTTVDDPTAVPGRIRQDIVDHVVAAQQQSRRFGLGMALISTVCQRLNLDRPLEARAWIRWVVDRQWAMSLVGAAHDLLEASVAARVDGHALRALESGPAVGVARLLEQDLD